MRAGKRTFKPPRLKSQIWLMKFTGFVCSLLNELNSKKNSGIFLKMRYNRGRKIPSVPIGGTLERV